MQFKTERIRQEKEKLVTLNPKLDKILNLADQYVHIEMGKELVVTEIYRSEDEYKAIYAQDLSKMPVNRPHSKWQAADLRSSIFTDLEIQKLLAFFHLFTVFGGNGKTSAIYHQVAGNVFHFHVQSEAKNV